MNRPLSRVLSVSLALLLAVSSAPDLFAQVIAGAAGGTAVPRVVGSFGAVSAPALSPLSAPSIPSLNASVVPALTPAPMARGASAIPAAAKPETVHTAAHPAAAAALTASVLPAPVIEEGHTPSEIAALRAAWQTAHQLVEPVPGAPESLADAPLTPEPGRIYEPSPEDWRDELLYFPLIDRFARSGPGRPVGDSKKGDTRHGGNLRGIIEKLDYLKGAGVTTLMLSPVTQTMPEAYHGYAPVHLMAVDPHLGTMDDMKELVREAHKRGMKVVLDWVLNHTGPVFEYKDGPEWAGMDGKPKEIGEWTRPLKPAELAKNENFTRRGVINNWSDPDQIVNGDFPPDYRHYDSARPETQKLLIHITNWWIKETDIDGLRLDAVKHLPNGFLPEFIRSVREYAATLGKTNFMLVGENSSGIDAEVGAYLGPEKLDSLFNYPAYRRDNKALHGKAPTRVLEDSYRDSLRALGPGVGHLLRFIDGHDVFRFLRVGEPAELLRVALTYMLLSAGVPILYYGSEQEFRQNTDWLDPENPQHYHDPENREDMFADGRYKSESSQGDKFDQSAPSYLFLKKIAEVRRMHAALRRGEQWIRWSDEHKTGIFAFSRIHEGQEVVVVLNFSGEARQEDMWVDAQASPVGAVFKDALDGSYTTAVHSPLKTGSKISVSVPPLSVRVLVRAAK